MIKTPQYSFSSSLFWAGSFMTKYWEQECQAQTTGVVEVQEISSPMYPLRR